MLSAAYARRCWCAALGGLSQDPQKPEVKSPEDIKAEETFTRNCIKCHPADRIVGSRRTRTQWEEVMTTMQTARGAVIADEDWDVMQTYLVKHYGRVNVNRATVDELVEVLGVTAESGRCHREVPQGAREVRGLRRVCQGSWSGTRKTRKAARRHFVLTLRRVAVAPGLKTRGPHRNDDNLALGSLEPKEVGALHCGPGQPNRWLHPGQLVALQGWSLDPGEENWRHLHA